MTDIIPLFATHYSMGNSLLTVEEAGKTSPGSPPSVCDIAKDHGLKQVVVVDDSIGGFIETFKHVSKTGAQLIYGVKLTVCADMTAKDDASLATESTIIVFVRNTQGYNDLIRLYNRAWTEGFYYRGRLDWALLRDLWTDNLVCGLPFFSSFIARNATTMSTIIPTLPVKPQDVWVFREMDSGLPFAPIIDKAIDDYVASSGATIQPSKTIYYRDVKAFRSYVVMKAIHERATFEAPRCEHLASDRFSWEAYRALTSSPYAA